MSNVEIRPRFLSLLVGPSKGVSLTERMSEVPPSRDLPDWQLKVIDREIGVGLILFGLGRLASP
jgi:hypothetical protein